MAARVVLARLLDLGVGKFPRLQAAIVPYVTSGGCQSKWGLSLNKVWCLCILDGTWNVAAESDPDCKFLAPDLTGETVLTNQQRNVLQSQLSATDLAVTLPTPCTVRQALTLIGTALGHTSEFADGVLRAL